MGAALTHELRRGAHPWSSSQDTSRSTLSSASLTSRAPSASSRRLARQMAASTLPSRPTCSTWPRQPVRALGVARGRQDLPPQGPPKQATRGNALGVGSRVRHRRRAGPCSEKAERESAGDRADRMRASRNAPRRLPLRTTNGSATRPGLSHPMHRHDVGACDLVIRGNSSTAAVAAKQSRQHR
jgi:hypothetical protein